jgi:N-acetylglutamate synthase-like GNAT family acetyltransferase
MSSYHLRPARKTDDAQIKKLIRQVGINPMGLDWCRFILAVDEEDRMVGCGQLKPHHDGSLELASIAVVPERRGEGIAREIIETLIDSSTGPLYLTCRLRLGKLYERFGFFPLQEGQMPPYFLRAYQVFKLLKRLSITKETLLVMKREPVDQPQTA